MTVRISKNDRAKLEKIYGKSNKARKKYNRLRQKGVEERQLPTVPTSKKRLIDYVKSTNMSRSDFNKLLDELVDFAQPYNSLLYTSDAADERSSRGTCVLRIS